MAPSLLYSAVIWPACLGLFAMAGTCLAAACTALEVFFLPSNPLGSILRQFAIHLAAAGVPVAMLANLAADRASAADLAAQILHLQQALSVVQGRLDAYQYPVLSLPNEIISEIFLHSLPVYPFHPPLLGINSPNTLLCICRQWRAIALATHALWSAFSLYSTFDRTANGAQANMAQIWLRRSRQCPLSIQMDAECSRDNLGLILPYKARWEAVKLIISASDILLFDRELSLLRHVDLHVWGPLSPTLAFPNPPLLRAVTLWDFEYPPALFPWSQLTSLTLIGKQPHQCTPILAQANNLLYCELVLFDHERLPQPKIALPRLKSLVFVDFRGNETPAVGYLSCFVVPALRTLQVPEICLGQDPIVALERLISGSGSLCRPRQVHITGNPGHGISEDSYRAEFPAGPKISFTRLLTDWYCPAAESIRARNGNGSTAEFETDL